MSRSARLGDRTIAFIEGSTSPIPDMPFLWGIDRRSGEAMLLAEVFPGFNLTYETEPFFRVGDRLYFAAANDFSSSTLWSTDGTPAGTGPVFGPQGKDFKYPAAMRILDGKLHFFAFSGSVAEEYRLWRLDEKGSATPVPGVRGVPPQFISVGGIPAVSVPQPPMAVVGGATLFAGLSDAAPETRPYGLFRLDDSGSGAVLLQDFILSSPSAVVEMGGAGYFSAADAYPRGRELWRTDGTKAGTRMVRDIAPGGRDSWPQSLTVAGRMLFFTADDGIHGRELWKSDGTEEGTVLVKDIRAGASGSSPDSFVVPAGGGQVFFLADDGEHGREVWRSDGSPEGTRLVLDVRPGPGGSPPSNLVVAGPWLLFAEDDGVHGEELWRTDGTEGGTAMVSDIAPGPASSSPRTPQSLGNLVFFSADDSVHGRELWQTDGSLAGTRLAADLLPGPDGSDPFLVTNPDATVSILAVGPAGLSLWELSAGGPSRLATLGPGTRGVSSNPSYLTDVGGVLCFFTKSSPYGEISKLRASDGTESETTLLGAIEPITTIEPTLPGAMLPVSLDSNLYLDGFTAGGSVNTKFYRFDLNAGALVPLADTYATSRAVVGQTLYFTLNFSELWKTDSAGGAVALVKRFDGAPVSLAASAGILYVAVAGGSAALWTSDGTESGTVPIWPGLALQLTDAAGTLYFVSNDYSTRQTSLWKIPAREPASVVRSFPLGVFSGGPISDLTASGGSLFFLLRDNSGSRALWKTDGTRTGAVPLSGVAVDTGSLRADESRAYFTASEGSNGSELWQSDGTPSGTAPVKDIYPGLAGSNPAGLTIVDGILLFSADDGTHGRELWRSDGTAERTYLLDDICRGACSSSPDGFTRSGGRIFFAASDEEAGRELWAMPASALTAPPGRRPPSVLLPRD